MTIKVLELFGGIGAPRKALINLGLDIEIVDYVDNDKWAVKAYNELFNENYSVVDIKDFVYTGEVDLIFHGSPCQDFSSAGINDLDRGRSILYLETIRIIKSLSTKPKYIIWENVKGLMQKKNINHFNNYLAELENLGFINYYQVLNAKDFGIPQNRERIFVVSVKKDLNQDFNFNNLEKSEMKPLTDFLDLTESRPSYFLKTEGMIKYITKIVDPYDENGYSNTITTKIGRHWWNYLIRVDQVKDYTNFIILPRSKDGVVVNGSYNRYWKLDKYLGTINVCNPLSVIINKVKTIENVPTFTINNIKYYLRWITEKESWLLMGFTENDFNKVSLKKTYLYKVAGNSIVVPVLEAIFKELFK